MQQNRSTLILGFLLILAGGWMIVTNQVPAVKVWLDDNFVWPMWTIGAGALILLIGLITGAPGMAIPASIVAGVGGILYYQEVNNAYSTWYLWMLIPSFVGVGMILAGLMGEHTRRNLSHGLRNIVVGVVLALVFGTLFGGLSIMGNSGAPILLILLGLYILARGIMRGRGVQQDETR